MSYWHDEDFQSKLLAFVCRDRNFLKRTSGLLSERDFKPRRGEGLQEAFPIAQMAFKYWKDYHEPIGGMLRTYTLDYIRENKRHIGSRSREKMLEVVEAIKNQNGLVAVEAIEKKVAEYKQRKNKANAIKELIDLQEKGELSDRKFRKICQDALETYDNTLKVSNYTDEKEIEKRINRREENKNKHFPSLMIDEFDKEHRTFPRGEYGLGLAKYGVGKTTFAVHLDQAYAMQGYKVLHYTTEDPVDFVEDRLDASMTGIKMKYLIDKSEKVERRLKRALEKIRGQIKIVDGTDGNMSVQRMEEIWETYRNQGFDADVIVCDYDEGLEPPEHYHGDNAETKEMKDIHKAFKSFIARRERYGWIMAQTRRGKPGQRKMIVTGDDAGIDISKLKRCALCVGIGDGPEEWDDTNSRYIYIPKHRYDRPKFGFPIMGDFERMIFYDSEATRESLKADKYRGEQEEE